MTSPEDNALGQMHEKKCFFNCVPKVIMKIGLPFQIVDVRISVDYDLSCLLEYLL